MYKYIFFSLGYEDLQLSKTEKKELFNCMLSIKCYAVAKIN